MLIVAWILFVSVCPSRTEQHVNVISLCVGASQTALTLPVDFDIQSVFGESYFIITVIDTFALCFSLS